MSKEAAAVVKVSEDGDMPRPWKQGSGWFQETRVGTRCAGRWKKEGGGAVSSHVQVHIGLMCLSWPGQGTVQDPGQGRLGQGEQLNDGVLGHHEWVRGSWILAAGTLEIRAKLMDKGLRFKS